MADPGVASHYQVLEELGRELVTCLACSMAANDRYCTGGSFGVVYKGIEKATGETVAIKHVSAGHLSLNLDLGNVLTRTCADRP
jgi:serine/threonine-protein kinase 24/25/MST4